MRTLNAGTSGLIPKRNPQKLLTLHSPFCHPSRGKKNTQTNWPSWELWNLPSDVLQNGLFQYKKHTVMLEANSSNPDIDHVWVSGHGSCLLSFSVHKTFCINVFNPIVLWKYCVNESFMHALKVLATILYSKFHFFHNCWFFFAKLINQSSPAEMTYSVQGSQVFAGLINFSLGIN